MITAADSLFQSTARRNQELADVFRAPPHFELQSRQTLPALTRFALQTRRAAASNEVHYLRTSQTLTPEGLTFLSRTLGLSRDDAYRVPGAFAQLARGLDVLSSSECSHGNPAPPTSAIPSSLVPLIQAYVFRTASRNVAAPPCAEHCDIPGFSTRFPQLRAEPAPQRSR